ncbi:hypothetical protein WA026_010130 [Henosepilachna vigintioctopunctata]|uniref:Gustatory receptor n=1 Tax=Henosepilachna vigintioctopunctata TaxID=420089 RepID=A0AAW1UHS2_9CUCU
MITYKRNKNLKLTKEIFKPFHYALTINGLLPFEKNVYELNYHKIKLFYGIIIFILSCVAEVNYRNTIFEKIETNSSIIKFIVESSSPVTMIGLFSSYYIIYSSRIKLRDIMTEFIYSDSQLSVISSLEGVKRDMSPIKTWSTGLIILYVFTVLRFIIIRIVLINLKGSLVSMTRIFVDNNQMLLCLCFILFLISMEERFITINKLVNLKIEESRNQDKYPIFCDSFNRHVDEIVAIHRRNTELMEKINSIFSFVLLVDLTAAFLNLLEGIHLILCKLTFHTFEYKLLETIELTTSCVLMALVPIMMAQKSMNLSNQGTVYPNALNEKEPRTCDALTYFDTYSRWRAMQTCLKVSARKLRKKVKIFRIKYINVVLKCVKTLFVQTVIVSTMLAVQRE